jgi:hypothetical protein
MRALTGIAILAVIVSGCHRAVETKENHYVHQGERATLAIAGHDHGYMAVAQQDAHAVARAVETADAVALRKMLEAGKAVQFEKGVSVKVTGESFNERRIEVEEGSMKGRSGWVPFEWLHVPAVRKLG